MGLLLSACEQMADLTLPSQAFLNTAPLCPAPGLWGGARFARSPCAIGVYVVDPEVAGMPPKASSLAAPPAAPLARRSEGPPAMIGGCTCVSSESCWWSGWSSARSPVLSAITTAQILAALGPARS